MRGISEIAVEMFCLLHEGVNFEFASGDRAWNGDVPDGLNNGPKINSLVWQCLRRSREALNDLMKAMLEEFSYA